MQSSSPVADFLSGRSTRPGRGASSTQQPSSSGNPLDLGASSAPEQSPAPRPQQPTSSGGSLDLGSFGLQQPRQSSSSPLDLGSSAAEQSQAPQRSSGNPLDLGSSGAPEQTPAPRQSSNPLDLGTSSAADPAPAPRQASGNPLDLSRPSAQPPTGAHVQHSSSNPLDLSGNGNPSPKPHGRYAPLVSHELGLPTIEQDERRILSVDDPVVHLTRMQSSGGALEFQAATAQPNQLLLGCAFETSDQRESMVLPGLRPQGPDPSSPIFRSTPQGVTVNLRAITDVLRFFIIGLPQTSDRSMPGGTLVIGTYGGSRLEVVLDTSATFGAKALVTGYVVEGRIVLRAEHDPFSGTLQQVAGVYGYDQMTWRDPFTPLF